MKLGMTSFTLRKETPENVVLLAKEAGISGIEWGVGEHINVDDLTTCDEIKALCEKNGIEVFSTGSYCRLENRDDLIKNVEAANRSGAPVIRIWAGGRAPHKCDEAYINTIVENARYMADKAMEYGIRLGFEFHHGTLTETAESGIDLIKRINRENVGLYWQPDSKKTTELNLKERDMVLPYCVGNMHIQNHTVEDGYMLLEKIEDTLKVYYSDIANENYNLMIEFVKDASVENLKRDAAALMKILG